MNLFSQRRCVCIWMKCDVSVWSWKPIIELREYVQTDLDEGLLLKTLSPKSRDHWKGSYRHAGDVNNGLIFHFKLLDPPVYEIASLLSHGFRFEIGSYFVYYVLNF